MEAMSRPGSIHKLEEFAKAARVVDFSGPMHC